MFSLLLMEQPSSSSSTSFSSVLSILSLKLSILSSFPPPPPPPFTSHPQVSFLPSPFPFTSPFTSTFTSFIHLPFLYFPPPLGLKVAIVSSSHLERDAKEFLAHPDALKIHDLLNERKYM